MDWAAFWSEIRRRGKVQITKENIPGTERIIEFGLDRKSRVHDLAYILATAYHETAFKMMPVVEAFHLSESWRKKNLRYYPWHGRGLVQTTWRENYAKMSSVVGVDLLKRPDALLDWGPSLLALFVGMEKGMYTGKKLADYIDDVDHVAAIDRKEYVGARRVVNGVDKAGPIADYALVYEYALKKGGYVDALNAPPPPEPKPEPLPDYGLKTFVAVVDPSDTEVIKHLEQILAIIKLRS